MPRPSAGHVAALVLVLLLAGISSSWAFALKDEICDIDADFALGREDYPQAIALHTKVPRAHNHNALAHYHLGFAYGMTGRPIEELREYLMAADLGLRNWDLFLNLGLAYLGQNDLLKAIKSLRTAAALGPSYPETHFNLAVAYERNRQLGVALQEIKVSLHLAPDDPEAHNEKAVICAALADFVCASDEWNHLVEVTPDYMPAQVNLAILNDSYKLQQASISGKLKP
jgi:Flp pilus assembly protein TadD